MYMYLKIAFIEKAVLNVIHSQERKIWGNGRAQGCTFPSPLSKVVDFDPNFFYKDFGKAEYYTIIVSTLYMKCYRGYVLKPNNLLAFKSCPLLSDPLLKLPCIFPVHYQRLPSTNRSGSKVCLHLLVHFRMTDRQDSVSLYLSNDLFQWLDNEH